MVNYTSNEPHNRERRKSVNEILTQEKSIYLQISEMIENDILRDIIL